MNGTSLTLGLVGALAVGAALRRGSRSERSDAQVRSLLERFGGSERLTFDELPREAQQALVWLSDGTDFYGDLALTRAFHDGARFALFDVPVEAMKAAVISAGISGDEWDDWDSYHHWYMQNASPSLSERRERWPVYLDLDRNAIELLLDGWHRLHTYVARGWESIPVLAVFW